MTYTAVVGIDRRLERHPGGNFNAAFVRPFSLAGLFVSTDPRAVKHLEHACGDAVVALIVIEAEGGVGVKRVEAVVLRLICPHLVGETKPAGFLSQIENDATAEVFEQRQSEPKLVPAVAAP